jgi:hypothetical protein
MARQIPPAYALSLCVVLALHKTDPKFLALLRSTVVDFQKTQPKDGSAWETLELFLHALYDPEIFVKKS